MLRDFFNKPGAKQADPKYPDAQSPEAAAQEDGAPAQQTAPYEGYSPIAPNIDTNPEPKEMAPENGGYAFYGKMNTEEPELEQEESPEGYWDDAGNFIYYGSEQDVYGYYDENGEYVYYEELENGDDEAYADEAAYAGSGAEAAYEEATAEVEPQKEKSYSVIADETTVMGNIKTTGHIDIIGEVLGNVDAGGNVAVLGTITGNVASEKMGLENCRISGDLKASVGIIASATSTIIGNVRTKNLLLDGKLKGNINAENVVVFRKNAYFLGDVQAGQIAIEMGAIFNGNIKMVTGGDPDAPFYEAL